ncbi:uncharacterized protein LOC144485970 [Mustelus asterias]
MDGKELQVLSVSQSRGERGGSGGNFPSSSPPFSSLSGRMDGKELQGNNFHKLLLLLLLSVVAAVSEQPPTTGPNTPVPGPGLSVGEIIGILSFIFFVGVIVAVIMRTVLSWYFVCNQNEASNGDPLREVTCSGEARGLLTTAPQHQDGAAGEQNLLENGTVKHCTEPGSEGEKSVQYCGYQVIPDGKFELRIGMSNHIPLCCSEGCAQNFSKDQLPTKGLLFRSLMHKFLQHICHFYNTH